MLEWAYPPLNNECLLNDKIITPLLSSTRNINGLDSYHIWPPASCDANPNHQYFLILHEQAEDNF